MKKILILVTVVFFGASLSALAAGGDGTGPLRDVTSLRINESGLLPGTADATAGVRARWIKSLNRAHNAWEFAYGEGQVQVEAVSLRPEEMSPELFEAVKRSATTRKRVAIDWMNQ